MNILIVGAGKVGSTLAAYLSREDHNVTIIDQNDTAIHRASDTLDVMCIKGPGAAGTCRSVPGSAIIYTSHWAETGAEKQGRYSI